MSGYLVANWGTENDEDVKRKVEHGLEDFDAVYTGVALKGDVLRR